MKIREVFLENFLSVKAPKFYEFDKDVILLNGPSGSGKTTILEAIATVLFVSSSILRSDISSTVNKDTYTTLINSEPNTRIHVDIKLITDENISILFRRSFVKSKNSIKSEARYVIKRNSEKLVDTIQISRYYEVLKKLYPEISSIKKFGINNVMLTPLSVKVGPSKIFKVIEEGIGYDSIKKLLKNKYGSLQNMTANLQGQITSKEKEIARLLEIQNVNADEEKLNKARIKLDKYLKKKEKLNNKFSEISDEIIKISSQINSISFQINKSTKLLNSNLCPTCERPIDDDFKIQLKSVVATQQSEVENLTRKKLELLENKKKVKERLSSIDTKILKLERFISKNTSINEISRSEIEKLQNEIIELKEEINKNEKLLTELEGVIEDLPNLYQQFKEIVFSELLEKSNTKARALLDGEILFENNSFKLFRDGYTYDYNLLSHGEKVRLLISIITSLIPSRIFLFDEILDALDDENYFSILDLLVETHDSQIFLTSTRSFSSFPSEIQLIKIKKEA